MIEPVMVCRDRGAPGQLIINTHVDYGSKTVIKADPDDLDGSQGPLAPVTKSPEPVRRIFTIEYLRSATFYHGLRIECTIP